MLIVVFLGGAFYEVGPIVKCKKSDSKLCYDGLSVGQSVLVSGFHLGPPNNFSPAFFSYFRHLRVCCYEARSLRRGRACSFQLLGIVSAVFLGLSPAEFMNIIFLCFREIERGEDFGGW
jgi:hypothetical protein